MATTSTQPDYYFQPIAVYAQSAFKGTFNTDKDGNGMERIIPSVWTRIWNTDIKDDHHAEVHGSTTPAIFRTPSKHRDFVPIVFAAFGRLPSSWEGYKFVLIAELDEVEVFRSEQQAVPHNDASQPIVPILIDGLRLMHNPPKLTTLCPVPFKLSGDFSWTLAIVGVTAQLVDEPTLTSPTTTRLDLYWVRAGAPTETNPPRKNGRPRVNMPDGYPISLLRMFAPAPTEFSYVRRKTHLVEFYIQRAMKTIWNPAERRPVRYDTVTGSSSYNMRMTGGDFALDKWVLGMFPDCNCMDLGGITQLACDLLQDDQGQELVEANYVCWANSFFGNPAPRPMFYVNEGSLFGWTRTQDAMLDASGNNLNLTSNNPLWKKEARRTLPMVSPTDPDRSAFQTHVWVEVRLGGNTVVLDNTRELNAHPDGNKGSLTRDEYMDVAYDRNNPHPGQAPTTSIKTTNDGPGYLMVYPQSSLQRLGVRGVTGSLASASFDMIWAGDIKPVTKQLLAPVNNPSSSGASKDSASALPVPRSFRSSSPDNNPPSSRSRGGGTMAGAVIHNHPTPRDVISKTYRQINAPKELCTADLNPERLISSELAIFPPIKNSPKVIKQVFGDAYCHQTISCETSDNDIDATVLDIYSFSDTADRWQALEDQVMKYEEIGQLDLVKKLVDENERPLVGDFSFEVPNTIFWQFRNLFVILQQAAPIRIPHERVRDRLKQAAIALDRYLKASAHSPPPQAKEIKLDLGGERAPVPGAKDSDSNALPWWRLPKILPSGQLNSDGVTDLLKGDLADVIQELNDRDEETGTMTALPRHLGSTGSARARGSRPIQTQPSTIESTEVEAPRGAVDIGRPDVIYEGKVFTVTLTTTEHLSDEMSAKSSDPDVVTPISPAPLYNAISKPGYQFWANRPGTATLTIYYAFRSSLVPGKVTIPVTVEPSADTGARQSV